MLRPRFRTLSALFAADGARRRGPERERLTAALLGAGEPELTCEQCFEQLDRYVDEALGGGDPDRAVPGMWAHLIGCPACHDDYESLLAYVAASDASDARR